MNQLFLEVLALLIILQAVAGVPIVPCGKLKDSKLSSNNIYLVVLKENHTEEDANGIVDAVNKYQSSLENNGTEDTQSQIKSQLTYHKHVRQLIGTLTEETILLVCNDNQVELICADSPAGPVSEPNPGYCNLPEENKKHSKIVFEYNSTTTDLFAIKEELQSTAGVISSSVEIHEATSSVVVKMNRTAYLKACNHSEIISVQYYRDSSVGIQENICRNISRAINLFCFNKTDSQRYRIDYYYKKDSAAERRCNKILSQLKNPASEDVYANIDVSNCTSEIKVIAGSLNIEALKMVCEHRSANTKDKVRVVHEPATSNDLCKETVEVASTPTPTCHPKEGCPGPTIPGL